jgi:hypothetical protein
MMTPFNLIQSLRSWFFARDGDIVLTSGRKLAVTSANIEITGGNLVITTGNITITGTVDGIDISSHAADVDAHHAQAHTVASHSDTTGTGSELNTLTDGSDASSLHDHDGRYFQESEFSSSPGATSKPLESNSSGYIVLTNLLANNNVKAGVGIVVGDTGATAATGTILAKEISTPGTPTSGYGYVYFDTASRLTAKNDSGTVANFYPTSAFSANPGAASAPLISDSNGDITLKTITSSDAGVSFDAAGSVLIASAGVLRMSERSTPGTPPSGNMYIYPKTDGRLYYKNDGGTEYGPL